MIRVIKRKKGTVYEAVIQFKGRPVSKSFETWQDANKWINEQRFNRDKGRPAFVEPVTVEKLFQAYLNFSREKARRPATIELAESRYKNYIQPWYERVDMTSVTVEEHQAFLSHLLKKGKSSVLRNRIRSLLQVMYSVAIRHRFFGGVFQSNPFQSIEPSEESQRLVKFWIREEKDSFLRANIDSPYYPLFFFLLHTGVRIGEALGAHGEQIHRTSQLFTIDRQFSNHENKVVFQTKGKRIRTLYLIDEVMRLLEPIQFGPLFKKPDGSALGYFYFVHHVFPKACKRAEIKNIGPHGTRHTFAANYLMEGGSLWDLSKILGHSSTEVTEKRYGHFDLAHVKSRMKVIERSGNVLKANFG
jgi:integrase